MYSPAAIIIIIYKSFLRSGLSEFPGSIPPVPVCLPIPILNASTRTSDKYTLSALSETQLLHLLLQPRTYLIAGDRTYQSSSFVEKRLHRPHLTPCMFMRYSNPSL